ncbi:MAG TPA: aminodeoxychorismate lyase [Thiobacillaceae bacterium]|nr:aminodeoxychorismate lyase [Thiobacillaceae bacterium]
MILINGLSRGQIPVTDRGLQYGDGVFRTMRAASGRIAWWSDHYAKLSADAKALGLICPPPDLLLAECLKVAQEHDCVVKLILTRGVGPRGYAPSGSADPTRIIQQLPPPANLARYLDDGIKVRWCSIRLGHQPRLAGIKHLNRLENVLARSEWSDPEIAEGLLLDESGRVISGIMSNILVIRGRTLFTPDLSLCGVAGVGRQRLMRAAQQHGMAVRVTHMRPQDVYKADELGLCNSLIGVWRIRMIEETSCGNGGWVDKMRVWLDEDD